MIALRHGDCLDVLRTLEACSVDAIVTDPPYGLSFMGKRWDYDVPAVEVWAECLRVLKPGGYLLAFAGTRTQHRMATRIEDAGFEIRDMIAWVYGSGFPKSHNGPWGGTALKPAMEPITMARKPLIGTVAANVQAHGTGGLNIDGCRTDAGRWPANLIHDGSNEVMEAFPDAPGQMAAVGPQHGDRPSIHTYGDWGARPLAKPRKDAGSAARFFYCAKASRADRNDGCEGLPEKISGMVSNTSGQHITRRDGGAPGPSANFHPTVKPTALMRYLCRLVTPAGGVVLDPFMGSGSTGRGAVLEGFDFIGIEREAEYIDIAQARIAAAIEAIEDAARAASQQPDLFAEAAP